jgi:alkanesulfonate monooxygenase SsuD/methylene tetrahydromethanopterin reductase-like flavin-dependent oxidoreductase (luciferase family)
MLAHTKRLTVFGTVHAPLFHPVAAAKQMVTADQIGHGRFALNVVVGWNEGEFDMFGADLRQHDARYEYAQEWLDIVRRIWTTEGAFVFSGKFFTLKGVTGDPKPYGGTIPLIMNAGSSPSGRDFTSRNCDLFFTGVHGALEKWSGAVASAKKQAEDVGRSVEVCAVASVTCRKTRQEARDFFEYSRVANADWAAVDSMIKSRPVLGKEDSPEEIERKRKALANGYGTPAFVGDPDEVATEIAKLSSAGIKAIGLDFFHYANDLPFFIDEVIPRLAKLGLRQLD